jgi:hypothetical protein
LVPNSAEALIAATAIKAAIRPYSMAVAPSSFFHKFVKVANIQVLLVAADLLTMHAKTCQSLKPAPRTMPQGG